MTPHAMTYRDRAAVEAYVRARALGELAYDAWLAALYAYGDDNPEARLRVNDIIATQANATAGAKSAGEVLARDR